jgi:hypothetical protein
VKNLAGVLQDRWIANSPKTRMRSGSLILERLSKLLERLERAGSSGIRAICGISRQSS